MPTNDKFRLALEARRAQREREAALVKAQESAVADPKHAFDPSLIPESPYERTDADQQMDAAVDSIDIMQAYRWWVNKEVDESTTKRREGIMVSCPTPGHRDSHPSAWVNSEKQTWFCGACQIGGDKFDIAAYGLGYPVPGYKEGKAFHDLRRDMAKAAGFTVTKLPGNITVVTGPELDPEPPKPTLSVVPKVMTPEPEVDVKTETTDEPGTQDNVYEMFEDEEDEILLPSLDWRPLVPEGTFLDEYMKATTVDDVAEEYHLWNGLIALGFALGRDVKLFDLVPVYSNLFVCTLGPSGAGKSKARSHLDRLLAKALPHDWSDPNSKGIKIISAPGSAEVLIHNFQKPVADATKPKTVAYYASVRGMIDFNELSSLVGRAGRAGNVIVPTLMDFYDMRPVISTSSMTTGEKRAEEPFASASTTTQPRALKGLITNQDNASGFLNRWVFATGREKKRFAIGGVRVDMTPAVDPLKGIQGWASSFRSDEFMQWSPEAAEAFTDWFHGEFEPYRKVGGDLIARVDLLMKKLVLLYSANMKQKTASIEAVRSALAMYDYIIESYGIPAAQLGNTITNEVTEAIQTVAKKQWDKDGKGVTLNQIARSLWRRKYPNDLLLKCCDSLVKLGYLEIDAPRQGQVGRPVVRYRHVG